MCIFTLLVVTALRAVDGTYDDPPGERARRALAAALVVAAAALFSRVVPLFPYAPAAQATFVGAALAGYASLLAAARWLDDPASRALAAVAAGAVLVALVLGRDVVLYTGTARLVNAGAVAWRAAPGTVPTATAGDTT